MPLSSDVKSGEDPDIWRRASLATDANGLGSAIWSRVPTGPTKTSGAFLGESARIAGGSALSDVSRPSPVCRLAIAGRTLASAGFNGSGGSNWVSVDAARAARFARLSTIGSTTIREWRSEGANGAGARSDAADSSGFVDVAGLIDGSAGTVGTAVTIGTAVTVVRPGLLGFPSVGCTGITIREGSGFPVDLVSGVLRTMPVRMGSFAHT